VNNKSTIRKY